jgi:MFS family permease
LIPGLGHIQRKLNRRMKDNLILKTLRIRPFLFLIVSEFFSQFSMNLFFFALLIVVFSVVNSNAAVSGVVIAFTLPALIFGVLAGVFVDRWNKKSVLIWTNLLRALIVLPLAFFFKSLGIVYIATFGVAMVTQFFIPAETPIIPLLVRKELLLSANALFGMGIYASIFLAYALSGPILLMLGQTNIFIFLTISFLIAGIFASLIKLNRAKVEPKKLEKNEVALSFKDEIKTVLNLISKSKKLSHALFSLTVVQILIYVIAAIGPGYAEHVLRIKVESFPILFVTPAIIGLALGALIIGSFMHKHPRESLTKFGLILMGISILLLPYGSRVESRQIIHVINIYLPHFLRINMIHIMVVLAFILGIATSFVFVPANTVLQEETSDQARGKVYGVLNSLIGIMSIIPVVVVGGLADLIGVKAVITGTGLVVIIIAVIRIIMDRD